MQTIIPLDTAENVRDMGGYKTQSGQIIRFKKLIRAAEISQLSRQDIGSLYKYGVRTIVDFRSHNEREQHPDSTHADIINHFFPVFDAAASPEALILKLQTGKHVDDIMTEMYRAFVTCETAHKSYRAFIDLLLNNDKPNQSILFHCTAGKDRTGFAAALFLLLMDVDINTILADYLRTNECLIINLDKIKRHLNNINLPKNMLDDLPSFFTAKEQYLNASFEQMKTSYDSIDNFMSHALNVTHQEKEYLHKLYLTT